MRIVEGGCYHNHKKSNEPAPKWAWVGIIVAALLTIIAVFRLLR